MYNNPTASEINNETNERISDRNVPSSMLQPYFSLRATPTKYTKMMDSISPVSNNVPLQNVPIYSASQTFYPTNTNAPWSGFAKNVDVESDMRNQFYALQSCPQATYVPASGSDLYTLQSFTHKPTPNVQSHPMLFSQPEFNTFNPNIGNTSNEKFNNHPRQDMKNIELD